MSLFEYFNITMIPVEIPVSDILWVSRYSLVYFGALGYGVHFLLCFVICGYGFVFPELFSGNSLWPGLKLSFFRDC